MSSESEKRQRGRELMAEVYAWDEAPDVPGAFFSMTAEHLFGDVWTREGLSVRDRRLMLFGLLTAVGEWTVVDVQLEAALRNGEFTPDELREVVVFLAHYAGWPRAAALNLRVEQAIARVKDARLSDGGASGR